MSIETYQNVAQAIRGSTIDGAVHEIRVAQVGLDAIRGSTIDGAVHEIRVAQVGLDAVTGSIPNPRLTVPAAQLDVAQGAGTAGEVRLRHAVVETIRHKPLPASWLPNYVFDGNYWLPLFPIAGTPHEARDRPWGRGEPFAMRSPDGRRFALYVGNDGALITQEILEPSLAVVSESHTNLIGVTAVSLTIESPSKVSAGNLLVANIVHADTEGISTPPSGWVLVRSDSGGGSTRQEVWTKSAGIEPNEYTWTFGVEGRVLGGIVNISNEDPDGIIEVEDSNSRLAANSNSDINKWAPPTTSLGDKRILLIFSHCSISHSSSSWSSSTTLPIWNGRLLFARYVNILMPQETDPYSINHYQSWWPFGGSHDGATQSVLIAPGD